MKPGLTAKPIALLFLVALATYLVGFYGIEHLRHRKGPWAITFLTDASGHPALQIDQPALNLRSVTLVFPEESVSAFNESTTLRFDRPGQALPFGQVLFEDLTFLPGSVALQLFGHEIELLPRVLVINRQPVPWASDSVLPLTRTNAPAAPHAP